MKNQKLFAISGLLLAVVFLAGCGQKAVQVENNKASENTIEKTQTVDTPKAELPTAVSAQPGKTADEEIKNIDNDLKAIDDNSLNQGLSDKDLGL